MVELINLLLRGNGRTKLYGVVTGLVLGMTVPIIHVKYEHKFKEYGWRLRMLSQKCCGQVGEKLRMFRNRVAARKKKEKKIE